MSCRGPPGGPTRTLPLLELCGIWERRSDGTPEHAAQAVGRDLYALSLNHPDKLRRNRFRQPDQVTPLEKPNPASMGLSRCDSQDNGIRRLTEPDLVGDRLIDRQMDMLSSHRSQPLFRDSLGGVCIRAVKQRVRRFDRCPSERLLRGVPVQRPDADAIDLMPRLVRSAHHLTQIGGCQTRPLRGLRRKRGEQIRDRYPTLRIEEKAVTFGIVPQGVGDGAAQLEMVHRFNTFGRAPTTAD